MTHCTDDELTRKLEALREPFEPAPAQKRAMHQAIFEQEPKKAKRTRIHWKPALTSFLLLIAIISTVTVLVGKPGALNAGWFTKDVTDSWVGVIMKQTSDHEVVGYYIYFDDSTMHIENTNVGTSFMGDVNITQAEVEKMAEDYQAELAKMTMQAGDYPDYHVKKKKDQYTITVPGKNGFTYTLTKTAPRQFVGEDDIRYSVNHYTEEDEKEAKHFNEFVIKFWWVFGGVLLLQAVLSLVFRSKKREISLAYTFVLLLIISSFFFYQGDYLFKESRQSAYVILGTMGLACSIFVYRLYKFIQLKKQ